MHFFSDDLSPAQNGRKHRRGPPSTLRRLWVHASFLLLGMVWAQQPQPTSNLGGLNFKSKWVKGTGIWGHFRKLKFEFKSLMYLRWGLRLGLRFPKLYKHSNCNLQMLKSLTSGIHEQPDEQRVRAGHANSNLI